MLEKFIKKPAEIIQLLKREIILFSQSPKEYLFSFTYSTREKVYISPFDPSLNKAGKTLARKLRKIAPGVEIYFVGAASLGVSAGDGDIDLLGAVDYRKLQESIPLFISLFGKPKKIRKKFAEWYNVFDGYKVDFVLADPKEEIFYKPLISHQVLEANPKHIKEYEELKRSLNGVSVREYKKRRMEFFNSLRRL